MTCRRSVAGWLTVVFIAGQLAILAVKELREQGSSLLQQIGLLGYAPNLIAALTLPALMMAVLVKRNGLPDDSYSWARLWRWQPAIAVALLLTLGALLGWEFLQPWRPNRSFDWQDIWATLAGTGAWLPFLFLARHCTRTPAAIVREQQTP